MSGLAIELPATALAEIAQRAAELAAEIVRAAPAPREPWLTVDQAAEHLGISTSHLYTLWSQRRGNGIPGVKERRSTFFRASELDEWRRRRDAER
jgi:excisionase family DNA binding protein